jgi:hypothetical protein
MDETALRERAHSVLLRHELSKGDSGKADAALALSPFTDAASQLSAAPLCLAILGQLNIIATGPDFTLRFVWHFERRLLIDALL